MKRVSNSGELQPQISGLREIVGATLNDMKEIRSELRTVVSTVGRLATAVGALQAHEGKSDTKTILSAVSGAVAIMSFMWGAATWYQTRHEAQSRELQNQITEKTEELSIERHQNTKERITALEDTLRREGELKIKALVSDRFTSHDALRLYSQGNKLVAGEQNDE